MALKDTSFIESMLALSKQSSSDASRNAGAIGKALKDIGSMFTDGEKNKLAIENQRLSNQLRQDALEKESKDYITSQNIQARLDPEKVAEQDIIREKAAIKSNIADLDKLLGSDVNKSTPQLTEIFKRDKESGLIDKGITEEQYRDNLRRTKIDLESFLNGDTEMNVVSSKDIFDPKTRVKTAEERGDLAALGLTVGGDETAIQKGVQEANRNKQILEGGKLDIEKKEFDRDQRIRKQNSLKQYKDTYKTAISNMTNQDSVEDMLGSMGEYVSQFAGDLDQSMLDNIRNDMLTRIKNTNTYKTSALRDKAKSQKLDKAMKLYFDARLKQSDYSNDRDIRSIDSQLNKLNKQYLKSFNQSKSQPSYQKAMKTLESLDIGSDDTEEAMRFISGLYTSGQLDGISDNELGASIMNSLEESNLWDIFRNRDIDTGTLVNNLKNVAQNIKNLAPETLKNEITDLRKRKEKAINEYHKNNLNIATSLFNELGINPNNLGVQDINKKLDSSEKISTGTKEPNKRITKSGRAVNIGTDIESAMKQNDNSDIADNPQDIGTITQYANNEFGRRQSEIENNNKLSKAQKEKKIEKLNEEINIIKSVPDFNAKPEKVSDKTLGEYIGGFFESIIQQNDTPQKVIDNLVMAGDSLGGAGAGVKILAGSPKVLNQIATTFGSKIDDLNRYITNTFSSVEKAGPKLSAKAEEKLLKTFSREAEKLKADKRASESMRRQSQRLNEESAARDPFSLDKNTRRATQEQKDKLSKKKQDNFQAGLRKASERQNKFNTEFNNLTSSLSNKKGKLSADDKSRIRKMIEDAKNEGVNIVRSIRNLPNGKLSKEVKDLLRDY